MGSGDFSDQSSVALKVDWGQLFDQTAEGAVNDMEITGVPWADIPKTLAEFTLDIMLTRLIEHGQWDLSVGEIARARGIVHEDGSWA